MARSRLWLWPFLAAGSAAVWAPATQADDHRPLTPVAYRDVRLTAGFWKTWQATNHEKIIPYVFRGLERAGNIENFVKAAGQAPGPSVGEFYFDSDVYKVIEGASYCLGSESDPSLAAYLDRLIATIAAAQQKDGYLHTATLLRDPHKHWKSPQCDEFYCAGHLFEAAVGRFEATGKDDLLNVARKLADLLVATYGPGPRQYHYPPHHQGVELGLLRLAQVTGQRRYTDLAVYLLEQRGRPQGRASYGVYAQDHLPVAEQTEAVGHTVRAAYMYAAMAELAVRGERPDYLGSLNKIFLDLTRGKMFVSGGVGLLQQGTVYESFADAFCLPNDQPDVDTCSVIGLVYWLHRMDLVQPDGKYGDLIERILYNRLLAGVALDGTRFFYGCPLASRGPGTFDRGPGAQCDSVHTRPKWFKCVCCPTNLPRLLATVGGYAYTHDNDTVYVDQYVPGQAKVRVGNADAEFDLTTKYPWDGLISIKLELLRPNEFALCLRIPGWAVGHEFPGGLYRSDCPADKVTLKINGLELTSPEIRHGYVRIRRRWQSGDTVAMQLPMNIRRVKADPRVKAAEGRMALMRGPILYCLEGTDHARSVMDLSLPPEARLWSEYRPKLLGGVTVLRGTACVPAKEGAGDRANAPHSSTSIELTAVPFYAWDNRRAGEMSVWLREVPRP